MKAQIEGHWTMSGGLIFGDAEDECAPFVKITFHNEASGLTEAEKLRLLRTLVDFVEAGCDPRAAGGREP